MNEEVDDIEADALNTRMVLEEISQVTYLFQTIKLILKMYL